MQLKGDNLKEYMNEVFRLEQEKVILETAVERLVLKQEQLQQPVRLAEPRRTVVPPVRENDNLPGWALAVCTILLLLSIWQMFSTMSNTSSLQQTITSALLSLILFAGAAVVQRMGKKSRLQEAQKEREEKQSMIDTKYENEYAEYQRQLAEYEAEQKQELKELAPDLAQLRQMYKKTENTLDRYYSMNVIDEAYRSIIPVASFVHYFKTGICDELEGPSGCYKQYRQEAMTGYIITQQGGDLMNLRGLSEEQRELRMAILEMNDSVDRLTIHVVNNGTAAQQHDEISQYSQKQIQQELESQHFYERICDCLNKE